MKQIKMNKMNRAFRLVIGLTIAMTFCMAFVSCSKPDTDSDVLPVNAIEMKKAPVDGSEDPNGGPKMISEITDKPIVEITMENGGVITIELDPEAAPITVANFLKLVGEEFYDGLTFHRIIPNFMIQGGDPDGNGTGGSEETIKGEFASNGWDNPIKHERGVLSMARSNMPDSARSQFFITNTGYPSLDGEYAAFGRVISGMDVVDEISAVATDGNNYPLEPVIIETIRVKGD